MKVVIGTAHVDETAGKRSPDGRLREPVYSREICGMVYDTLKDLGYDVYIDFMPLNASKEMFSRDQSKLQSRELFYRVKRVNELCDRFGKDNCLYVSLHNDAAGMGKEWMTSGGFSVWTTRGNTKSDTLAECIYDAAEENLVSYKDMFYKAKAQGFYGAKQVPVRMDKSDGDRDYESDLFVLRKTQCAAVLVEMLFQDNKQDVEYLLSDEGKHVMTRIIVEGILRYVNNGN